ncbi:hypothetical protein KSI01_28650 [Kurthia sibirica]|nr:hypothetical protein KSI01_28650 [Kurthia sibirica]
MKFFSIMTAIIIILISINIIYSFNNNKTGFDFSLGILILLFISFTAITVNNIKLKNYFFLTIGISGCLLTIYSIFLKII